MNVEDAKESYFEKIPCPVCGAIHFRSFIKVRYGQLKQKSSLDYSVIGVGSDTEINVDKCLECGFVFVNPRIKPEYENLVYNEAKSNMYINKRHLSRVNEDFFMNTRISRLSRFRILLKILSYVDIQSPLTLFDYGCGFGHSMSLAQTLGISVYGVDIDEKRLEVCDAQGMKVSKPDEFEKQFGNVKADIILWQSNIEHLVDLPQATSFIRDRSKKRAVLFVNGLTPAIISKERRKGQFIKAHFVEHINYFPIKTLHRFMAAYGFKPLGRPLNAKVQGKFLHMKDVLLSILDTPPIEFIWYSHRSSFSRLYRYDG